MVRFSVVVGASALILTIGFAACGGRNDYPILPPQSVPDAAVDAANERIDAAVDASVDAARDAAIDASMLGADLAIAITGAPDPVNANSTLAYTIDVANHGGLDAANLKVTQHLPPGNVAFQSATGIGWTCNAAGQIVTCTRATLLVGPGPSITVKVTTPPTGGSIATSASVSSDTPDPDMSNNDANATILVLTPADLAIAIANSPVPVAPQGMLSYTITVTNAGPGPATQIQVEDRLPSGVAFVSAFGAGWTCAAIGQDVTCQSMVLAMGASSVITLVATTPPSGGPLSNTVQVTAATPDGNTANNQASASTTVTPAADLAIAVAASPDPVLGNGTLQYAIDVNNLGPDTASGITVTDSLPANVVVQSATGSGWACTPAGQTVTCTRPSLPTSAAPTIAITVRAPSDATVLTNTAKVTSTSTDLRPSNNAAPVTTTVQSVADLSVAVTDAPDPVTAGAPLTYTITASNVGPSQATDVTVTSTLPAGATFQSAIGSNWTCTPSGQVVTCTTPVMALGTASAITIVANAPDVGVDSSITETSSISSAVSDPGSANNTASQTTAVNAPADLALQLSASANPVPAQSRLTYTIDVTNLGPRDATNVVVTNRLPNGNVVVVQNPSGNGWTCNTVGQLVTCTRPLLLVGAAPQISFAITAPSTTGTLVDQASVSASTPDQNPQNNSAANTTNVSESADLQITATADQSLVEIGHNVTYTLSVANQGPTSATAIQVVDTLPAGATFVSADSLGWSCTGGQVVTCTTSSLGASSSAPQISLVATAPATAGSLTNTATVISSASDPNNGNNMATVVTVASPFADLSIAVTDSIDPVQGTNQPGCTPNGCVIYSIDVGNAGPDAATDVAVDITLPGQGAFINVATDTNHTWVCPAPSGGHLKCTRTGLAPGNAPTLSLTWKAPSPGGFDILVSATLSGSSHDPDTTNNTATQATRVLP